MDFYYKIIIIYLYTVAVAVRRVSRLRTTTLFFHDRVHYLHNKDSVVIYLWRSLFYFYQCSIFPIPIALHRALKIFKFASRCARCKNSVFSGSAEFFNAVFFGMSYFSIRSSSFIIFPRLLDPSDSFGSCFYNFFQIMIINIIFCGYKLIHLKLIICRR